MAPTLRASCGGLAASIALLLAACSGGATRSPDTVGGSRTTDARSTLDGGAGPRSNDAIDAASGDAATRPAPLDGGTSDAGHRDAGGEQPSRRNRLDHDGSVVAIDGDRLVTGGRGDGAVYVYALDGCSWTLEDVLLGDDASFGRALALSGDTLIVGAHGEAFDAADDDGGLEAAGAGAAFVFERVSAKWTLQQRLAPSPGQPGEAFGYSVALRGDDAVVGSLFGAEAYVFERRAEVWSETQRLGGDDARWGEAVAIDGDTLVISSAARSTRFHIFARSEATWVEQQVLTPASTAAHNWGAKVSLDRGLLAVGVVPAFMAATMWPDAFVHVFRRDGQSFGDEERIAPGSGVPAVHDGALLVGAPLEAALFIRQGAARLFDCASAPCAERATLLSDTPALNAGFGGSLALGDRCAAVANVSPRGGPPQLFELGSSRFADPSR